MCRLIHSPPIVTDETEKIEYGVADMVIWDVFSQMSEKELPLKRIEDWFNEYYRTGNELYEKYRIIAGRIPDNLDQNERECMSELIHEGKKVAFLIFDGKVCATIGYKEQ